MIIDGKNMIMGRLASFVAKKALLGEESVIVNCDRVVIVGSKKDIVNKWKRKIKMGDVFKGPFVSRSPDKIMRRAVRGMLNYKTNRGSNAYKRVKCFVGIPEGYKKIEIIDTFKVKKGKKYIDLKEVSNNLGRQNG